MQKPQTKNHKRYKNKCKNNANQNVETTPNRKTIANKNALFFVSVLQPQNKMQKNRK